MRVTVTYQILRPEAEGRKHLNPLDYLYREVDIPSPTQADVASFSALVEYLRRHAPDRARYAKLEGEDLSALIDLTAGVPRRVKVVRHTPASDGSADGYRPPVPSRSLAMEWPQYTAEAIWGRTDGPEIACLALALAQAMARKEDSNATR